MHRPIGLKKATKVGLRKLPNGHVVLGRLAEEELFRCMGMLNEGELRDGVFFGSTMLDFDLNKLAPQWRGPLSSLEEQKRLLKALSGSITIRLRLMRLARAEAARRIPEEALGRATIETRFALQAGQVHVDVDLEVPISVSSGSEK